MHFRVDFVAFQYSVSALWVWNLPEETLSGSPLPHHTLASYEAFFRLSQTRGTVAIRNSARSLHGPDSRYLARVVSLSPHSTILDSGKKNTHSRSIRINVTF